MFVCLLDGHGQGARESMVLGISVTVFFVGLLSVMFVNKNNNNRKMNMRDKLHVQSVFFTSTKQPAGWRITLAASGSSLVALIISCSVLQVLLALKLFCFVVNKTLQMRHSFLGGNLKPKRILQKSILQQLRYIVCEDSRRC